MPTYSSQCSAVGSFAYAGYFKLYVELTEKWVDNTNNTSYVDYNVYCQSSGSGSINANHYKYFSINGEEKINTTENVNVSSPNAYISIASGTIGPIYHNEDGSKSISFYAEIKGSTYGVQAVCEGTFELTQIPRYTTVNNSERGKTLNSISINWSTTDDVDWLQYSLNSGAWQDAYGSGDGRGGYYTISDLNPNTQYSVKTRCRRRDSQLWSEAETINITTYDIARVTSASNINLGDNATININNPGNANINYYVEILNPTQTVLERVANNGSNTIVFTDSELDMIYKKMGSSNSTTLRFGVNTNNTYWQWIDRTCTLTGNQKTIKAKTNAWKRGKVFVKINGTWKRGVMWTKSQGAWKRGI